VAEPDRFTERLQAEPPPGMTLEVLNLGVNSYTLSHYVSQAELEIMDLHPDLVLVGFTLNDNDPRSRSWPAHQFRDAEAAPSDPGMAEQARQWAGRLAGARMLREVRDRLQFALMNADEREAYHTKWMRRVVETWQDQAILERVRAELAHFKMLMQAQGTPYAMVLFPERNDLAKVGSFDVPRQTARRLMEELGMPVCDPFPRFAQAGDAAALFLPGDSVHFSPAGHRLLRDGIAACLADGRIPAPRNRP
jgi:lysophospholipase L1-like esterase